MYSVEHKKYLRKQKRENYLVLFFQLMIIILFLALWQISAELGWINTFISSSPKAILETIVGLHQDNNLYQHIFITVWETFISFSLGTLIGILIATILWYIPFLNRVVEPYLTILNSLPKVALGPIIIIWCGAGMKSIIFMALLISVIITIINVYQGFSEIDSNKIRLLQSMNATKTQIYRYLILPGSFNTIISALKINISLTLIGVIMGEFLVSKSGIGYLIMYGSQVFNLDLVITGVFILCIVAALMYYSIFYLEKFLIKHTKR